MTNLIQRLVLHIFANIAGLYVIDYAVKDFCVVADRTLTACPATPEWHTVAFVAAAILLALVNGLVKPLLKLVSLPFVFLSMGLFLFLINAVVLWLVVWLVDTMAITGVVILVTGTAWATYLYAGVILGLFNLGTHWLTSVRD